MLLLVYTLVKAPDVGWGAGRTIAGLAGSAVLLAAFVVNELRVRNPLVPLSILRVKGVAAADATQLVAMAGFLPMFFFLTLYMQTVLDYSPIQTGVAYLPLTGGFIIAASISLAAVRAHRHQAGRRARHRDLGRRPLLAVADPGRRLLRLGHPARPADRLDRHGRRLHRPDHGSQRRRRPGQGRSRRRAPQHRPAARCRARPGDPLGGRHRAHEVGAAGRPRPRPGRDRRLPARAPGRRVHRARGDRRRAPDPQQPPDRGVEEEPALDLAA